MTGHGFRSIFCAGLGRLHILSNEHGSCSQEHIFPSVNRLSLPISVIGYSEDDLRYTPSKQYKLIGLI